MLSHKVGFPFQSKLQTDGPFLAYGSVEWMGLK